MYFNEEGSESEVSEEDISMISELNQKKQRHVSNLNQKIDLEALQNQFIQENGNYNSLLQNEIDEDPNYSYLD
jgi:hypothetical protein